MLNKRKSKKAAGASPQTPLGSYKRSPRPLCCQGGARPLPYTPSSCEYIYQTLPPPFPKILDPPLPRVSSMVQPMLQMVPHCPLMYNSTRPRYCSLPVEFPPPASLTEKLCENEGWSATSNFNYVTWHTLIYSPAQSGGICTLCESIYIVLT